MMVVQLVHSGTQVYKPAEKHGITLQSRIVTVALCICVMSGDSTVLEVGNPFTLLQC